MNHVRITLVFVLLMLSVTGASHVDAETKPKTVTVYVEPSTPDDSKFSNLLKVELAKRKGAINANVDIVRFPEQAQYVLECSVSTRKPKWHEGWLTFDKPTVVASIFAYDQCGKMVWTKNKGDLALLGGAGGALATAQKVAWSFKTALAKKNSRLNKAKPCITEK